MNETVILLSAADLLSLAQLRTRIDLEAAREGDQIWVKGLGDTAFRQLPALCTWRMDADQYLFAQGAITPERKLPALDWQPLQSFIGVSLPVSALPAVTAALYTVKLAPAPLDNTATAILTSISTLLQYITAAPQVRFHHLHFAVAEQGETLIIGHPLPPLPGMGYSLKDDMLVPVGYDLFPPVIRSLVNERFNGDKQVYLLFYPDGSYTKIPLSALIPVTRSAVRLTAETFSHVSS